MALAKLNTAEISNRGIAVPLLHPATQVPVGIRWHVLGCDSEEFRRIIRKQQAELREKQKRSRGGVYIQTPEEKEQNGTELLVGLSIGWDEDVLDAKGKVIGTRKEIELNEGELVPFSPEAARQILEDPGFNWIRELVDAGIGDRRDFLPSGS